MSMKSRNLELAAAGLPKIVVSSLRRAPAGTGAVLAWPLACGSAVAARTSALDFTDEILRVEVPDKGWRRELMALAPQYLAVLNRFSRENVKRIEFVVAASAARSGEANRAKVQSL
jgi:hypothetical protein